MTKPNELTLAIERVEALAESDEPWDPGVPTIHDRAALRLVIEAAKRPMALSGEERKSLEEMQAQGDAALARALAAEDNDEAGREWSRKFHARYDTALTAALSLASPFTREELGLLRAMTSGRNLLPEEDALLAKLDAMLAQSSPAAPTQGE